MTDQPRTIEILVSPEGKVKLTTHGFIGTSCRKATRFLKAALGKVSSERKTPEYYETVKATPIPNIVTQPKN